MKKETTGEKELPIGVTLLLILLCVSAFLLFCFGTGIMIDAIVVLCTNCIKSDGTMIYIWRIIPVGLAHVFFFMAFCLDGIPGLKKSKRESYREDILGMFLIVMVFTSVVLMALAGKYDRDIDGIIAVLILPAIGIVITPKMVKKTIKKLKKWEDSPNNLSNVEDIDNMYKVKTPVVFEKQLFGAVFKYQFKHLFVGLVVVFFLLALALIGFSGGSIPIGWLADRGSLASLVTFFVISILGIPAFIVYLTNSILKLRIVKEQKYKAYHVVAKSANDKAVIVEYGDRSKCFEYPVCVGIRKNKIHDTKATLIFLPEMVMIFPDEKYK
ncbi:MAG: hypothetical protein IKS48_08250 [Eubacterium sp.]|nr:hypothetical protein [Eubacterium sp.]